MGTLTHDLLAPGMEMAETHTSWVFLGKDSVWKLKKPVDFGFLNFTTPERRKVACDAEIALNSRLAPQVYRGVVPVTVDATGRHSFGGTGNVVDHAVEMVRLADAQRADILLDRGALTAAHLETLAERLAAFHERMPTDEHIASFGSPQQILTNIRENFSQTRNTLHDYLQPEQARELEARQLGFVEDHRELFISRIIAGKVRDGHGDLRLEHIYLQPDPTIIDCIEFNERFRYGDVCSDIAFLTMDLARAGRVDLSERLLAAYASAADDFDLYRLVDFYEGYRAFVRGKVASLLAEDSAASVEARQRARQLARRHYLLALASGREALSEPVLLVVGGLIGSGKSTVAAGISASLAAPVVATDRTRKYWLGVTPRTSLHESEWSGVYSPELSERIYGEALRRAACVLGSGRSVIIDGSFRSREHRGRAHLLAHQLGVPFFFVECRATPEEARARLHRRAGGAHVSDARVELFDEFAKRFEPIDEFGPDEHIVADTSRALPDTLQQVGARLPVWPPGH
ncbi:MAG TPA: AAA family ATPase [Polyangiaceae bacterium]|nr:AAA family ATPase [Polyangiaceae bacterium]